MTKRNVHPNVHNVHCSEDSCDGIQNQVPLRVNIVVGLNTMSSHRTHVVLPEELIKQIDALVGKRGRSAFLAGIAQREIIRLKQMKMLEELASRSPADLSHHPEWENPAEWVSKVRQEAEERFKRVQQELNRDTE